MEANVESPVKKKKYKEPTWSDAASAVLESAGDFLSVNEILERIQEKELKDVASSSRSTSPFARLSSIMATNSRSPYDIFSRCPNRRGYFFLNPDYRPGAKRAQNAGTSPGSQGISTPASAAAAATGMDGQDAQHRAALVMTEMFQQGSQLQQHVYQHPALNVSPSADSDLPVLAGTDDGGVGGVASSAQYSADVSASGGAALTQEPGTPESRQPVAQGAGTSGLYLKKRKIVTPSRYEPDAVRPTSSGGSASGKVTETPRKLTPTSSKAGICEALDVPVTGKSPRTSGKKARLARTSGTGERRLKVPASVQPSSASVDCSDSVPAISTSGSGRSTASAPQLPTPSPKRKRGRPPDSPKLGPPPKISRRGPSPHKQAAATLAALSGDLESPDSILKESNLKNFLNTGMFAQLPEAYQGHLLRLLPDVDRGSSTISNDAFNNVFLNSACQLWKDQLKDGDFAPEVRSRLKAEYEKRLRLDPWKAKHFERFWGEKRRRHAESLYVLPPSLSAIVADLPDVPEKDTPPSPITPKREASPSPAHVSKATSRSAPVDGLKFLAEAAKAAGDLSPKKSSGRSRKRPCYDYNDDSEWEMLEEADDDDENEDTTPVVPQRKKRGRPPGSKSKKQEEKKVKEKVKAEKTPRKEKTPKVKTPTSDLQRQEQQQQSRITAISQSFALPKSNITVLTSRPPPPAPPPPPHPARAEVNPQAETIRDLVAKHPRVMAISGGLNSPTSQRHLKAKLMCEDFRSARTEGLRESKDADVVDLRTLPSSQLGKTPPRSKVKHLKNRLARMPILPSNEVSSEEDDGEQFPIKSSGFDHAYAKKTEGHSKISMMYITSTDKSTAFQHAYCVPTPEAGAAADSVPSTAAQVTQPPPPSLTLPMSPGANMCAPSRNHVGHTQLGDAPACVDSAGLLAGLRLIQGVGVFEEASCIETFLCTGDIATPSPPPMPVIPTCTVGACSVASSTSAPRSVAAAPTAPPPAAASHTLVAAKEAVVYATIAGPAVAEGTPVPLTSADLLAVSQSRTSGNCTSISKTSGGGATSTTNTGLEAVSQAMNRMFKAAAAAAAAGHPVLTPPAVSQVPDLAAAYTASVLAAPNARNNSAQQSPSSAPASAMGAGNTGLFSPRGQQFVFPSPLASVTAATAVAVSPLSAAVSTGSGRVPSASVSAAASPSSAGQHLPVAGPLPMSLVHPTSVSSSALAGSALSSSIHQQLGLGLFDNSSTLPPPLSNRALLPAAAAAQSNHLSSNSAAVAAALSAVTSAGAAQQSRNGVSRMHTGNIAGIQTSSPRLPQVRLQTPPGASAIATNTAAMRVAATIGGIGNEDIAALRRPVLPARALVSSQQQQRQQQQQQQQQQRLQQQHVHVQQTLDSLAGLVSRVPTLPAYASAAAGGSAIGIAPAGVAVSSSVVGATGLRVSSSNMTHSAATVPGSAHSMKSMTGAATISGLPHPAAPVPAAGLPHPAAPVPSAGLPHPGAPVPAAGLPHPAAPVPAAAVAGPGASPSTASIAQQQQALARAAAGLMPSSITHASMVAPSCSATSGVMSHALPTASAHSVLASGQHASIGQIGFTHASSAAVSPDQAALSLQLDLGPQVNATLSPQLGPGHSPVNIAAAAAHAAHAAVTQGNVVRDSGHLFNHSSTLHSPASPSAFPSSNFPPL
ncbi:putative Polycomb group protein ASXL2 isoform X1 [Sycon ciliatum]|uniref:putative Polycomb group protein ASXL2 isoform X1 n=2 Tax=Sycon ciliatum TaxID=27933 RepID=UPI0031F6E775